ncbi:hypothetical protein L1987_43534 [Smallanthus sonchifolius]|uniref:Uncharacterized protein n=1 Tax=Smallanthus sonchifolius TaxID=185202 RepID=A0ACB9GMW4_9ASTR|nr:hypothetical protein L1987_43534 [Smallanthus sonchifolius]
MAVSCQDLKGYDGDDMADLSLDQDARNGLTPLKLRAKAAKFAKATVKAQMASFKTLGKFCFFQDLGSFHNGLLWVTPTLVVLLMNQLFTTRIIDVYLAEITNEPNMSMPLTGDHMLQEMDHFAFYAFVGRIGTLCCSKKISLNARTSENQS